MKKYAIIISAPVLVAFAIWLKGCVNIDKCMDGGGRWNYQEKNASIIENGCLGLLFYRINSSCKETNGVDEEKVNNLLDIGNSDPDGAAIFPLGEINVAGSLILLLVLDRGLRLDSIHGVVTEVPKVRKGIGELGLKELPPFQFLVE